MVRKNCYKYNGEEIKIIVNEYLNTNITFKELADKYDRSIREVMLLLRKHYDMDELEAHHIVSFRSGGLPIKDNMVLITKENHSRFHSDNTMTAEDLKNKRNAIIKSNGHSLI